MKDCCNIDMCREKKNRQKCVLEILKSVCAKAQAVKSLAIFFFIIIFFFLDSVGFKDSTLFAKREYYNQTAHQIRLR